MFLTPVRYFINQVQDITSFPMCCMIIKQHIRQVQVSNMVFYVVLCGISYIVIMKHKYHEYH